MHKKGEKKERGISPKAIIETTRPPFLGENDHKFHSAQRTSKTMRFRWLPSLTKFTDQFLSDAARLSANVGLDVYARRYGGKCSYIINAIHKPVLSYKMTYRDIDHGRNPEKP